MSTTMPTPTTAVSPTQLNNPTDLRVRLRRLLRQQKHTDCSFLLDRNVVIASHRIILAIASPVFEAMFFGPLAETALIHIADIGADAFRLMLEYIYTDELNAPTQIEDLIELYYCAQKYMLTELQPKCGELIRKSLRHDNILQAIDAAVALHIGEPLLDQLVTFFAEYCLIGRFFAKVLAHNHFHMSKESLNYILGRTDIKQQNINLVCLVQKWCRTEAKLNAAQDAACDVRQTLQGVRLPASIEAAVRSDGFQNGGIAGSNTDSGSAHLMRAIGESAAWISCQRKQFRAVRPLRQTVGQPPISFHTSLQSSRFIALRSVCIASRLAPLVRTQRTVANQRWTDTETYTEQLAVAVEAAGEQFAVRQSFVVFGVEYNSTVSLVFENPVLMVADVRYAMRFEWPACNVAGGREYPLSVMAPSEPVAGDVCELQFDGHLGVDGDCGWSGMGVGSVLVGVEFVVLG